MKKITLLFSLLLAFASSSGQVTVGSNSGSITTTGYPSPLQDYFKNSRSQFLYTASELSAAGLVAGNITKIGWVVTNLNTSTLEEGYTISMKSTAITALTTTFETGTSLVYGPTDFTPTAIGNNLFVLTTPFLWDGTSNIIIEICEGATTGAYSTNVSTTFSTLSVASSVYFRSDGTAACPQTAGTTSVNRPQLVVAGTYAGCLAGSALTSSAITATTATVSWSAPTTPPANGYDYYYDTTATAPTGTTTPSGSVAAGIITKSLTGLTPSTNYNFYIRSKCSATSLSSWSPAVNFVTACVGVSSFSENFDAVTVPNLPNCWGKILNGTTGIADVSTGATNSSAPNGVSLYNSSSPTTANILLVSPALSNLSSGLNRIKFSAKTGSLGQDIIVGTISNPNDATTFTALQTVVLTTTFTNYTLNFNTYTGSDTYIAFKRVNTSTFTYVYLDDIVWEPIPSCVEPTTLISSAISSTGATISWTAPLTAPANGYNYYYSTSPTSPIATTTANGSVAAGITTKALTGLSPDTVYYFWIRSVCSATSSSNWSVGSSFRTLCVPITVLPWNEGFESIPTASLGITTFPNCWFKENGDWSSSNGTFYNTPRSGANYITNAYSSTNEYMWTPGFQLTAGTSYDFSTFVQGDGFSGWTVDMYTNSTAVSTGATALGSQYVVPPPTGGSASIQQYAIMKRTFIPATTGTYFFAVKVNQPSFSPWYLAFDDFKLELTPSCADASSLVASAITTTTATVSWTAPVVAPANGYDYINTTSSILPTATSTPSGSVGAGVTTISFTGLTQSTTYYFYVRSKCSATTSSSWTALSYTTITPPPANDDCVNAVLLTVGATVTSNPLTGNTTSAANTVGLTSTCTTNKNSDVWYKVVVPASGNLTLETTAVTGSLLNDTVISVLASCGGTELGCNDDTSGGSDGFSKVILTGQTVGSTVYVGVWKYGTTSDGLFKLSAYDASLNNSNFNTENFLYYPNPVNDILNLKYSEIISNVSVVNLLGQTVLNKSINQNELQLDMSSIPTGTYLVKITSNNLVKTIKVNKL